MRLEKVVKSLVEKLEAVSEEQRRHAVKVSARTKASVSLRLNRAPSRACISGGIIFLKMKICPQLCPQKRQNPLELDGRPWITDAVS